jgi:SHS2 domain-containing protein
MGSFEILEHPADIGFSFQGETLAEAFRQAARALLFMQGGTEALHSLHSTERVSIEVEGADLLEVLYNWLSEILFFFDSEQLLLGEFHFERLNEHGAKASVGGQKFDQEKFETPYYVKAITYHEMKLEKNEGGWNGRVFVDI